VYGTILYAVKLRGYLPVWLSVYFFLLGKTFRAVPEKTGWMYNFGLDQTQMLCFGSFAGDCIPDAG